MQAGFLFLIRKAEKQESKLANFPRHPIPAFLLS